MPSVIKRMAMAICAIEEPDGMGNPDDYIPHAKAAIEAIAEPTQAMVDVGVDARWRSAIRDANSVREIWAAMINAALYEVPNAD